MEHVVVDGVHAEVLHEPLPSPADALGLAGVGVAPVDGVPNRLAHPAAHLRRGRCRRHRPVVHLWLQPAAEEVLVPRLDQQRHGSAREDVLEADGPREALGVDLVAVRALRRQPRVRVPGFGLVGPVLPQDLGAEQGRVVARQQRHPQRRRHVRVPLPVRRRHPVCPLRRPRAGLDAPELTVPWLDVRLRPASSCIACQSIFLID